jgi:hypothetical protein
MNLGEIRSQEFVTELTQDYVKWQASLLTGWSLQFMQPAAAVLLGLGEKLSYFC